ncbi:mRNA N(3)-methylcytidine methyltransferase METTL8 [Rhincodon typus]|uniref:mRNA N(3)-methylcytidine methyltransferase METTL8 n=1 Tax=Rhincodon typus TaxID=259920 RepID=UPI00202FC3C2|nr:mRNA N(3)-methylcytidine methyltransferase METTL8 [Rhincodon typus]XP_048454767.1 mRNA N(3)-methylcytidine methyltransferase METTL8 [Rhincodon typus]XP_048454768.1 mRNA N(3)-methylcytidine methyltransferase METTL8 [Rhincodon typus]XP_048454769.1 mRNA N(3)-methylcytidine methyltransferase METTL8 [Rhincodon typus]XP_048454770.1 mRNA N(3)-methylcytidine methyltransferase METTL8 [Rhincodon typus]XP_048454771.1 mRNA N(3)-methylcytidine methyltransferase METTL8 [Rhincodon typus]XP_048454772.1 mR
MKRRSQVGLIHTLHLALRRKLGLQCKFQSSRRPTTPLGSRVLSDPSKIFEHNMWDHIQWTPEQEQLARQKAEENSSIKVSLEDQVKYDKDASVYWDKFYRAHQNKFFKDRRWLFQEFPELFPNRTFDWNEEVEESTSNSASPDQAKLDPFNKTCAKQNFADTVQKTNLVEQTKNGKNVEHTQDRKRTDMWKNSQYFPGIDFTFRIFEVGCGAGNSVFPVLDEICNPRAFLYCCDFSESAVELVKSHPSYDPSRCYAFVHDLCNEAGATYPFPDGSIDVILLVFVLSSIHPKRMQDVINRLSKLLKPGGMILFRDYGRYDMTQLRLKKGRCLFGNFYVRGDGTCVYFFTKEETSNIFISAGLKEVQNVMDRRLQVNRKKRIAMHRVWVQCKYLKPPMKCLS